MGKTTCAFFRPGGSEIMFASTHLDPKSKQYQDEELAFRASGKERRYAWDYDAEMDIFTFDEKTGATKRLTTAKGYDAEGGYSPDGQWIVFSSMRDAYNRTLSAAEQKQLQLDASYFAEVYIMKADGSEQKRLTTEAGYDGGTFFTKDGRIVWRHFEENGLIANVWTMKPDGTDKKQITDFGAMSWAPYEHPSGEYFLFASNKLGFENFEVFMVDKAGLKEPVRITYYRRIRWPAGAVSGRHAGRVHVEPRRGHGRSGTDLSGAVESRRGNGGVESSGTETDTETTAKNVVTTSHGEHEVLLDETRASQDTASRDRRHLLARGCSHVFANARLVSDSRRTWRHWRRRRWRDASPDRLARSSRRII